MDVLRAPISRHIHGCIRMAKGKASPSETQKGLHSTFGRLEGVSERVIQPSTLTYRERVQLRSKHGYEYGRYADAGPSSVANSMEVMLP